MQCSGEVCKRQLLPFRERLPLQPPLGTLARRNPFFFFRHRAKKKRCDEKKSCEKFHQNFRKTSRGSFSAVSTPIFASKYSFESSRGDLHNALLCTVLQSQNFSQKSSTFFRDGIIEFPIFFIFFVEFCIFSANF